MRRSLQTIGVGSHHSLAFPCTEGKMQNNETALNFTGNFHGTTSHLFTMKFKQKVQLRWRTVQEGKFCSWKAVRKGTQADANPITQTANSYCQCCVSEFVNKTLPAHDPIYYIKYYLRAPSQYSWSARLFGGAAESRSQPRVKRGGRSAGRSVSPSFVSERCSLVYLWH